MAMDRPILWKGIAVGAILLLAPRETTACPTGDVPFVTQKGDTLSDIAARSYCLTTEPELSHAWHALHEHNRDALGSDPHQIHPETLVCLPERISHGTWNGTRCESNPRRQEHDAYGDADRCVRLIDAMVERLACRAPCGCAGAGPGVAGVEKSGPVEALPPKREPPPPPPPLPPEPLRPSFAADVAGGVLVPFSASTRNSFYRSFGVIAVGARITLRRVEIVPRAMFVAGWHGTIFADVEQPSRVLGGGASVHVGVPFAFGAWFRVTPALGFGWLSIQRQIKR